MKAKNVIGLVFANVHDELIGELAAARSMASVPFGGRYRLIDFPLSCMVNAGISNVGVIPKYNYHSLLDHLGSGKAWDLDRKSGGLSILPPYVNSDISMCTNRLKSINAISGYLNRTKEEYVLLCDAGVVGNIDLTALLERHAESGAEITVAYKNGSMPQNEGDVMALEMAPGGRVQQIKMISQSGVPCNYSLNLIVMKKDLMIKLANEAVMNNKTSLWRDVFQAGVQQLNIYGYEVPGSVWVIDSPATFAKANFALLQSNVRQDIFCAERPIYTKIRDDVPTRYGLSSKVSNSLIADGCFIEGTVENSIIFRGATVGEGTVVKNCIIMQDCVIGKNADLAYMVLDKNVTISDGTRMCGAETHLTFIRKNAVV